MRTDIAIVGLACEFPGAKTPEALWETALLRRRWFRNIPAERMEAAYFDVLGERQDTTRSRRVALLEGYAIPQSRFALGENDVRSADFSHWLALDCADRALRDSGLGDLVPRDSTRVIVGNSLTGEYSRADLLRLRWPYVRKTLEESGCNGSSADWERREQFFKARLTQIDGRTLAGALSNVIAGRIANQLDLRGGCYCVDAACASSLVAIAQGCSQLVSGEIDCCIVGGVDVSLDPFELVGFSVAGALAGGEMKIFDRNRSGFLPGEGCGFAVLMRADDPLVAKCRVHAVLKGWAITSDGRHDLTAPSPHGQRLALQRAYAMAGYDIGSVPLFEAHGTGTVIGDQVELSTLATAIDGAPTHRVNRAAIGSIKANIGHTKAAAGMAGLIKAIMALESRLLPPTTGCFDPMPEVDSSDSSLRLVEFAEPWPDDQPLRAGISGFGFGGVNAHVTIEAHTHSSGRTSPVSVAWQSPLQDAELFVFDGIDHDDLLRRVSKVQAFALNLADAELASAAKATGITLNNRHWRAAIVARTPDELDERLSQLISLIIAKSPTSEIFTGVFLNEAKSHPRIGFLFPGQGGNVGAGVGQIWSRFRSILGDLNPTDLTADGTDSAARIQSSLVATSVAATKLLAAFGIQPSTCIGHSLGEISALCAAGALSEIEAVSLAYDRGHIMDGQPAVQGRMDVLFVSGDRTRQVVNGFPVVIAAFNSPKQTVIAGPHEAVANVVLHAHGSDIATATLSRRFAFHSPAMQSVVEPFTARLRQTLFSPPQTTIFSTVTGKSLSADTDLASHLADQLTSPVLFRQAFELANHAIDLWIELGAGRVLTGLIAPVKSTPLEVEKASLGPLLDALAAAFVHGVDVRLELLYGDRRLPSFDLDWVPRFFTNPCERPLPPVLIPAAASSTSLPLLFSSQFDSYSYTNDLVPTRERPFSPLDAVRTALAHRKGSGFSAESIQEHQTLGPDLGVDSLGLTEIAVTVEKLIGRRPASHPLKKMTVAEFAALFEVFPETAAVATTLSDQLAHWVRAFEVVWDQAPIPPQAVKTSPASETDWTIVSRSPSQFTADFVAQLQSSPAGLLIHCDREVNEGFLDEVLAALHSHPEAAPIVFLDSTSQFPGFAKSLALEQPTRSILFVHFPEQTQPISVTIASELHSMSGFHEVRFDADGRRFLPRCQFFQNASSFNDLPVTSQDVVLVTGGAKGITAECMIALASKTGASFAIIGRSRADDRAVLATRKTLSALGISHDYWSTDISDPATTAVVVRSVIDSFGPITAIIHGAGTHEPSDVPSMTSAIMIEHCRAKVDGLRNLVSMVDPVSLKLLVAFGSIVARSGYASSGAYAFANDRLARVVADFQSRHQLTQCMTLDWSAWLEAGMSVNLGAIAEMKARGIDPIRNEEGVQIFLDALRRPVRIARPILAGRLPTFHTVSFRSLPPEIDLPQGTVVSHTPGVEIIADTTLSLDSHPFLVGHRLDGQIVLPGVLLMEFIVKTAAALGNFETRSHISDVTFYRPISLPATGSLALRIQAVLHPDGSVQCRLAPNSESLADSPALTASVSQIVQESSIPHPPATNAHLNPTEGAAVARELYQHFLFHTDAFCLIQRYSTATAKTAVFHLLGSKESEPLAPTHSDTLIRDAFVHGIQICVPSQLLLPSKVASITRHAPAVSARTIIANEVSAHDGEFVYNVIALDALGSAVEVWQGLVLRRYRDFSISSAHHPIIRSIHHERTGQQVTSSPPTAASRKRYFEYRHIVGFKETNLVGNVYFTNHIEWQGRCREMFLHEHALDVLKDVQSGQLALVTVSCSCEYLAELQPFDELSIRMTLEAQGDDWATMRFEYWRDAPGTSLHVAIGYQKIASRRRGPDGLVVAAMPKSLVSALQPFT